MNKASPIVIAIAVAAAVAVAAYSGYSALTPKEYRPTEKPLESPDNRWLRDVAKRVGGDASKLTPDERRRADQITRGNTDLALRAMAQG